MEMNNRRQFFKGAGLFGTLFAVGGTAIANTEVPKIEPVVEDISHLAPPENATTIQITGAYGEQPKPQFVNNSFGNSYYINGFNQETTHKVSMAVGKDNRLWIKVGDEWKRVALEG